jgi:hypothetical protein
MPRLEARRRWCCAFACGLAVATGCGRREPATPAAYALAQAVHAIAGRQHAGKLAEARAQLATAKAAAQVTPREAALLEDWLAAAEAGDWPTARRSSRQFLESQIVR